MASALIRLRNKANGVVVNVDQATAVRLGSGWADPDEAEKPAKLTAAQRKAAEKAAAEQAEADAKAAAEAKAAELAAADAAASTAGE